MPRNYYIVLGINRTADLSRIKKAYRTLAKKYHPNVSHSPESSERFREVKEAYETLSNEGKRKIYDEELSRQGARLRVSRLSLEDIGLKGACVNIVVFMESDW